MYLNLSMIRNAKMSLKLIPYANTTAITEQNLSILKCNLKNLLAKIEAISYRKLFLWM